MEQDIKILETIVNYRKFDGIYSTNEVIFKAIEHLIKAYKELEEANRYLKTHIIYPEIIKLNFIPVSLVEEKIEELNEYYKKEIYPSLMNWSDIDITEYYDGMIGILQELLERKK